jgi:hypothetical protein
MSALAVCLVTSSLPAAESAPLGSGTVRLEKQDGRVEVTIDGGPFAVYHFGKDLPKPYFWPVRGPGGTVLTRSLENPKDHPHQKGIWLAIDEVNGVDFWAEKGKIENVSVELVQAEGNPARMRVVNHWLGEDDKPVLIETTEISIYPNRVLAYDIGFRAADEAVTFGDTKEGLFGFRMVDSMRGNEGGTIVSSEGARGEQEAWGKTWRWVDYYGPVEGKTFGVAVFDHPENFRPSRYHVRNYGLFSISPFGESAYSRGEEDANEARLKAGEQLRLRYAMYIHSGDTEAANVDGVYQVWVKAAGQ